MDFVPLGDSFHRNLPVVTILRCPTPDTHNSNNEAVLKLVL